MRFSAIKRLFIRHLMPLSVAFMLPAMLDDSLAQTPQESSPTAIHPTVYAWFPEHFGSWKTDGIEWDCLTHLCFRSIELTAEGHVRRVSGNPPKDFVETVHRHGVKVTVLVWTGSRADSDGYLAQFPQEAANNLLAYVKENNLDGVNIDDEQMGETNVVAHAPNRELVTRFFQILAKTFKSANPDYHITFAAPPVIAKTDRFATTWLDLKAIAEVVDGIIPMGYTLNPPSAGWATNPEPLGGGGHAAWTTTRDFETMVCDYLEAMGGHREKLLAGVSLKLGGYEWRCRTDQRLSPTLGNGVWHSLAECEVKAIEHGPRWDDAQQSAWYCYRDSDAFVQGWFNNARAWRAKLDWVKGQGLGGIGIWVLDGANDPLETWQALRQFSGLRQSTTSEIYFPPPESQGGWRTLTNADDLRRLGGMSPDKLAELKQWLLASDDRNFAAVVIRHGYIVLELERGNSAKTDSRRVASVSKAICAIVLAIASEQSQLGLTPRKMRFDDPAFEFIPWAQPLSDPRKARITVKQLLNHTSGLCPEAAGAPNDGAWEYILGHTGDSRTAKLAFDPGTGCGYSTHAFAHAALVCESVTGKPYDQFAIEALFRPLGVEHWWFQYYEGGEKYGRHPSHGLGLPARDLARVAYCMLRDGRWRDKQVIPQWFVQETAAPTQDVKTPEMRWKLNPQIFSHGWELPARLTGEDGRSGQGIPADARDKPGSGGQFIAFVPSLDLVVTRQTGSSGEWQFEEYLRRACDAAIPKAK